MKSNRLPWVWKLTTGTVGKYATITAAKLSWLFDWYKANSNETRREDWAYFNDLNLLCKILHYGSWSINFVFFYLKRHKKLQKIKMINFKFCKIIPPFQLSYPFLFDAFTIILLNVLTVKKLIWIHSCRDLRFI